MGEGTRPRGHTSLTGAVDAQLRVRRDVGDVVVTEVEYMKDGAQGDQIASKLKPVLVGLDEDGEEISSCIVEPADIPTMQDKGDKITKNQRTYFTILYEAGSAGLTVDQWNERARAAGLGIKRRADLADFRSRLKALNMVIEVADVWKVEPMRKVTL